MIHAFSTLALPDTTSKCIQGETVSCTHQKDSESKGQPVDYAYKHLSWAETRYANIKWEYVGRSFGQQEVPSISLWHSTYTKVTLSFSRIIT